MSSDNQNLLAFRCPHCDKRLRTRLELAGRKLKCPKCAQTISVPAPSELLSDASSRAAPSLLDDDPFQLSAPAIDNLEARQSASENIRAAKAKQRETERVKQANRRRREQELSQSAPQKPTRRTAPELQPENKRGEVEVDRQTAAKASGSSSDSAAKSAASGPAVNSGSNRSVFDDDSLDLDELRLEPETPRPATKSTPVSLSQHAGSLSLDDLDALIPEPQADQPLPPLLENEVLENAEYRVVCKVCGTAQYVHPSTKGMKIKCPDCHSSFKVPPPPAGWKPSAKKPRHVLPADYGYVPEPHESEDPIQSRQKERTARLLEKAKGEISEEAQDRLYDSDFDTAGFVQGTFGFLRDPLGLTQVAVYGIVFACLFGLACYSWSDTQSQFGRGLLLISVILIPLLGILFALPMLSGCLALIEAAANKQRFISEIPSFNIFDNFADVMVLAVALLGSIVPGFVLGSLFGGEESSSLFSLFGMVLSGYLLFPIFLLSMMDNGSVFSPISGSIIRSFSDAAEAWGGYYLKTLVATATILVLWLILLGRTPLLAGIAGLFLPLYLFFTCQQIGTLADQIGDNLSFEFTPPDSDQIDSSTSAPE